MPGKRPIYCSACARAYTRASTCREHSRSKHGGTAYPVSEVEYIIGRLRNQLPNPHFTSGPPMFRPQKKKEQTYFDKMTEEYSREIGRRMAQNAFPNIGLRSLPTNNFQNVNFEDIIHKDLFGMKGHICGCCFEAYVEMISPRPGDEGGGVRVPSHNYTFCAAQSLNQIGISKKEYAKIELENLPALLIRYIYAWTKGKPNLSAKMVSGDDRLSLVRYSNGEKSVLTLNRSQEISIRLNEQSLPNWARRAILSKHTLLTESELMEFLGFTNNTTYAFITVQSEIGHRIYLFAIDDRTYQTTKPGTEESSMQEK